MKKITRKINKQKGQCGYCFRKERKKEFKQKTMNGLKIFTCKYCGYHNSESIFTEYKKIKNQQMIFGQTKIK